MAEVYKILGQMKPAAVTITIGYAVPASTSTIVSSLTICNTNSTSDTVRVYVVPSAGGPTTTNALYYELPLTGHNTFVATLGLTLATGDELQVRSTTGNTNFQFFGTEVS